MARKDRENLEQLMAANPRLQEQLEERIAAAVTEARAAWEAEQAAPEEAPEPEEARRLAEERQALEEEKAAFARQRMEVAVGQESAQRIDAFEVLFQEAIAQAVTSRMRGSGAPKAPQAPRGYSWEELRNMTHQEINANWTAVQKALESGG